MNDPNTRIAIGQYWTRIRKWVDMTKSIFQM